MINCKINRREEGTKMTLTKILGGTGFWCCLLGIGGMAGAIEFGTGWIASIILLVIGIGCFHLFCKEGGTRM